MADLSTLAGLTFSADNYAYDGGQFVPPDFSQFSTSGSVTVSAETPGLFSNADVAAATGGLPISATVASVDTSTATSYRLGTVLINEIQDGKTLDSYTADIIAINSGQVLLGIGTYNAADPSDPYGSNYAILSDTSLTAADATTTYSTSFSNTNPTAYSPPCFAAGTMIATPDGDVAVEAIKVGDLVTTLSGAARPVIWTGARHVDIARHPRPETVRPVRIAAGAFDDNVPARDLLLSPDHSVHVDGVLIPVKYLVNNTTVTLLEPSSITYHHIELDEHDVVLANGLPAETYLDTGNRLTFARPTDTVFVPHPDFATACDVSYFTWDALGFAPLVLAGEALDAVRTRLSRRAGSQARAA